MTDRPRDGARPETVEILGVQFDNLTRAQAARRVTELVQEGGKGYVVKPYSEFMARAHRDGDFRRIGEREAVERRGQRALEEI